MYVGQTIVSRSKASVTERLREHMKKLVEDVAREFDSGLYSGSPEAVAEHRERFLAEVLSRFMPRTYDMAKGKIYDAQGGISDSIDIVILGENHPRFRNSNGQVELLLADGIHAAVELKPVLSDLPPLNADRAQSPEIWRALEQARTVKRLQRVRAPLLGRATAPDLTDYARRVPAYIVTAKAPPPFELATYIDSYFTHHSIPIEEQFDVLAILNHGILVNVKYDGHFLQPKNDDGLPLKGLVAYETENSLIELLYLLLLDISSQPRIAAPFLPEYFKALLKSDFKGYFTCKA